MKRYYSPKSRPNALVKTVDNNRCDLPQDAMIKDTPQLQAGGFTDYDDTMTGIDKRIAADIKTVNRKGKIGRF